MFKKLIIWYMMLNGDMFPELLEGIYCIIL